MASENGGRGRPAQPRRAAGAALRRVTGQVDRCATQSLSYAQPTVLFGSVKPELLHGMMMVLRLSWNVGVELGTCARATAARPSAASASDDCGRILGEVEHLRAGEQRRRGDGMMR